MGFNKMGGAAALALGLATLAFAGAAAAGVAANVLSVPPGHFLSVVFSNAAEGKDAAYNSWYDGHLAGIARLPDGGVVWAQRFVMKPSAGFPDAPNRYMAIYEKTGDPQARRAAVSAGVKTGVVPAVDLALMPKNESYVYVPVGPAVKGMSASTPPEARFYYLVFSNSAEGKDQAFNAWYDKHMAGISKLPDAGTISVQRFEAKPLVGFPAPPYRHLAIYVRTGDPQAGKAAVSAGVKAGKVVAVDPKLMTANVIYIYDPLEPAVKGADAGR